MKNKLKIGTLFSGIGALEQALIKLQIPHEIIFANDIDKYCKLSYDANYQYQDWYNDINEFDGTKYQNSIDILMAGTPCQSFSMAGNHEGLNDPRGSLIFKYINAIKEISPKVFIFENVKGLLNMDRGKVWNNIILPAFQELGYHLHWKLLNAKDFGIPQNRMRLFLIGFKENISFKFPKSIPLMITMQDLLVHNPQEKYFLSAKMKAFALTTWSNDPTIPEVDLKIARTLLSTMAKMHRASFDNYISCGEKLRRLTPRECLRLMGFSDDFKIVVSDTQIYRQAGNSIVVNVLEYIIKEIISIYRKERD